LNFLLDEPTSTQSNSFFRPLSVDANNNVETEYLVQYYNTPAPQNVSPAVSTTQDDKSQFRDINKVQETSSNQLQGLDGAVSRFEYWTLDNVLEISGSRNTKVSIPFATGSSGPTNYLGDLSKLVLAGWTRDNYWENRGGANQKGTPNQVNPDGSGRIFGSEALSARMNVFTVGTIGNALPIELLYFRAAAKEGAMELTWATAKEINNDYFTIERSADGQNFSELLRVNGAGNSQTMQQYTATDASPLSGMGYYRLKQTDRDGTFSYSKVAAIQAGKAGNLLQVYQPGAGGELQVGYSLPAEESGLLRIYDSRGIQVWSKAVRGSGAQEQVRLGAGRGLYLVTLQSSSGTLVKKVMMY
jgi:hypothetical protein